MRLESWKPEIPKIFYIEIIHIKIIIVNIIHCTKFGIWNLENHIYINSFQTIINMRYGRILWN